jgi:large subunit ribosomal protein L17
MAASLILHKRITTTIAKAKALRSYVEPLITKSKDTSTHSQRVVFSYLQNNDAVHELFYVVSGKIANRAGGYTRILKTGIRQGDSAEMCIMELVDFNTTYNVVKETAAKTVKTRRGTRKKETTATVAPVVEQAQESNETTTESSSNE